MTTVSIGQVKRDISELVNRVAYGGERIVLTSRGKPKAVLISIEDYERLEKQQEQNRHSAWRSWVEQLERHMAEISARRQGESIDVDTILAASRADLESRNDYLFQR
jgi:prevent-host-death family protein